MTGAHTSILLTDDLLALQQTRIEQGARILYLERYVEQLQRQLADARLVAAMNLRTVREQQRAIGRGGA